MLGLQTASLRSPPERLRRSSLSLAAIFGERVSVQRYPHYVTENILRRVDRAVRAS